MNKKILIPILTAFILVFAVSAGFIIKHYTESAKQEAIDTILEFCALKQEGKIKAVICTGCLAERYKEEVLKEIPELDAVIGIGSNSKLSEIIRLLFAYVNIFCNQRNYRPQENQIFRFHNVFGNSIDNSPQL